MDVATKFSKVFPGGSGEHVTGKAVVSALCEWSSLFGAHPKRLVTDQGSEFINRTVVDFGVSKGIAHLVTPAYTPASNGLIERHNGLLKDIFYKLFESVQLEWSRGEVELKDIVFEAVAAKNSVVTKQGFTAQYLAFGYHPIGLNSIDTDFSQEEGALTDFVRKRDLLRVKAQEMVLKMRTNERLREMINGRLQGERGQLEEGTKVEYHPLEPPKGVFSGRKWIGPCSVLHQETTKLVWLRFPDGTARLVHRHRVRPVLQNEAIVERLRQLCVEKNQWPAEQHLQDPNRGVEMVEDEEKTLGQSNEEGQLEEMHPRETEGAQAREARGTQGNPSHWKGREDDGEGSSTHRLGRNADEGQQREEAKPQEEGNEKKGPRDGETRAQKKQRFIREGRAAIAERREKRKQRTEQFLEERKRQRADGDGLWVEGADSTEGEWWGQQESFLATQGGFKTDDPAFDEAKMKEWESWERHDVFEWVKDEGQRTQRTRWILTKKTDENGEQKLKARLCAQGTAHQDHQLAQLNTESPTASRASMRHALSIAASNNWHVYSFDVSCAFLQGMMLEDDQDENMYGVQKREVHLRPPKEFREKGWILRLKKVVYGYADAPRRWFNASDEVLKELGMTPLEVDPATYVLKRNGDLQAMLCMHVDDGVFTCSEEGMEVMQRYMQRFTVGKFKMDNFTYTGVVVSRLDGGRISLSQKEYVRKLAEIKLERGRSSQKAAEVSPEELRQLRKLVGAMTWVAAQTRPDVAAEVSMIQSACPKATVGEIVRANKIVRRLKATEGQEMVFENLKGPTKMLVFTDAALQNVLEGEDKVRSQGGYVIAEVETSQGKLKKRARFNVLAWGSNKIRRVCRSSFGAEALAACAAADAGYVARLGVEEVRGASVETYLVTDSLNLRDHLRCIANNVSEKRLKVELALLKEYMKMGELTSLLWVDGSANIADSMTKNSNVLTQALEHGELNLETLT